MPWAAQHGHCIKQKLTWEWVFLNKLVSNLRLVSNATLVGVCVYSRSWWVACNLPQIGTSIGLVLVLFMLEIWGRVMGRCPPHKLGSQVPLKSRLLNTLTSYIDIQKDSVQCNYCSCKFAGLYVPWLLLFQKPVILVNVYSPDWDDKFIVKIT